MPEPRHSPSLFRSSGRNFLFLQPLVLEPLDRLWAGLEATAGHPPALRVLYLVEQHTPHWGEGALSHFGG